MADSNHLDKNAIVDIFVQYGDHLYEYVKIVFQKKAQSERFQFFGPKER